MRVSIIVPMLNEAPILPNSLRQFREAAPDSEIVVIDGGSQDGSFAIARELADQTQHSKPGRAMQMNAGAALAHGDILWFVHADSVIAPGSIDSIEQALSDRAVVGGCFRLRIDSTSWVYRIRDAIGNFLVAIFRLPLGDRGFFCWKKCFDRVGGFPDTVILEDAEFYRRLKEQGRVVQVRETIQTSARRYEKLGPVVTMLFYTLIMLLYALRVPVPVLERMVRIYMRRRSATVAVSKTVSADVRKDLVSSLK
jgi:rSAM/selenodomain-associated transferase 2